MNGIEKIFRIQNHLESGNYKTAIREAQLYIKQGAKLPLLYHELAIAYLITNQFKESLNVLKTIESKFPDFIKLYELMGDAYSGLKETDNAMKYYNLAIEHGNESDRETTSMVFDRDRRIEIYERRARRSKKFIGESSGAGSQKLSCGRGYRDQQTDAC